jgi:hypothetical protein
MIASQVLRQPFGDVDFSFGANKTQRSILQYLRDWLPLFLKEFYGHFPSNTKEDDISGVLALFLQRQMKKTNLLIDLNRKWGSDFQFTTDEMIGAEPIFPVEAKRLPSTSTRDYVHHHKKPGGISRFKEEQSGFGEHLTFSAMVGYVQKYDFDYLFKKVNGWISDLIESDEDSELRWSKEDMLVEAERGFSVAEYTSKHERISKKPIHLTHFWLDMVCGKRGR